MTNSKFKTASNLKKNDKVNFYDEVLTVASVYVDNEIDYVLVEFTSGQSVELNRMSELEII